MEGSSRKQKMTDKMKQLAASKRAALRAKALANPPPIVRDYLAALGSKGGKAGSRESKQRAGRLGAAARAKGLGESLMARCREAGVSYSTARWRLRKGWTVEEALAGKRAPGIDLNTRMVSGESLEPV